MRAQSTLVGFKKVKGDHQNDKQVEHIGNLLILIPTLTIFSLYFTGAPLLVEAGTYATKSQKCVYFHE